MATNEIRVAVVGAHLTGQPLNKQLTEREGRLIKTSRTAPEYRLHALKGTVPPKPGLERLSNGEGSAIEVEVWALSVKMFGSFVALIPPPLGMGTLRLEDGSEVKGFICEPYAFVSAEDISRFGGWRGYLEAEKQT